MDTDNTCFCLLSLASSEPACIACAKFLCRILRYGTYCFATDPKVLNVNGLKSSGRWAMGWWRVKAKQYSYKAWCLCIRRIDCTKIGPPRAYKQNLESFFPILFDQSRADETFDALLEICNVERRPTRYWWRLDYIASFTELSTIPSSRLQRHRAIKYSGRIDVSETYHKADSCDPRSVDSLRSVREISLEKAVERDWPRLEWLFI